jgi:hypothetical protein
MVAPFFETAHGEPCAARPAYPTNDSWPKRIIFRAA